ncbi:MAG: GTP 3',8-cyclase MoaA [Polyangia bacterium]
MTLKDAHARTVEYVRLSLTERCNLACTYCVPSHHEELPSDWMTDDEIVALIAALQPLGLRRVRLTGGEPTLRPRLPQLVARLARLGLADLSLTTNATRLSSLAVPLREAGLHRLNLSLDTLDASRFRALSGGDLDDVLAGIDAAKAAGFVGGKLNVVALDGINDGELVALARFAWAHELQPRYIELMPMSDGAVAPTHRFLPVAAIRARLEAALGTLEPCERTGPGVGPARHMRVVGTSRTIGFISAVTEPFCSTCNRIRISARGRLHTCLGIDDAPALDDVLDLRAAVGRGPDAVRAAVTSAVGKKGEGHTFDPASVGVRLAGGPRRHMIVIGG